MRQSTVMIREHIRMHTRAQMSYFLLFPSWAIAVHLEEMLPAVAFAVWVKKGDCILGK